MGIASEEPSELTDDVKDMIVLYRAMVDSMRTFNGLKAGGNDMAAANEMNRHHRLEAKVNTLWIKLPVEKHLPCVLALIESGHMDPLTADMLTGFKGMIETTGSVRRPPNEKDKKWSV